MEIKTKQIPKKAFGLVAAMSVGDNGENSKTAPFKMLARTGDPLLTPWFDLPVVHDMAGMQLHKPRLSIDYVHNDSEVIGYANNFDIATGDLVAGGALISFTEDDRAAEVIYKAKAGIPWEASITFDDDCLIEEVPEGYTVNVNNRDISGPVYIFRKWSLRAIAVCPMGMDKNTKTELNSHNTMVNITIIPYKENKNMSENNISEIVEAPQVEAEKVDCVVETVVEENKEPEIAEPVVEEAIVEGNKEIPQEGEDAVSEPIVEEVAVLAADATQTIIEGEVVIPPTPEPVIMSAEMVELKARLAALETENNELQNRLSAIVVEGQKKPVSFSVEPVETDFDQKRFEKGKRQGLSDGVAKFAASIKLPKHK